jgi:hypothetical protein
MRCNEPYDCGFWQYCAKHVPTPSVFDLHGIHKEKAFKLYSQGSFTFDDLQKYGKIKNDIQQRQIDYTLHDKGTYIDKENIRVFLQTLSYPLYFLDFEGMQPIVPPYPQSWAYEQVPFQYSLHYIESENGELKHKEFLGVSGEDPRRAIAESLCENIPENVCTVVYNKNYECTRLKELAKLFPDLSKHLLNIRDHIVDLLVPFQKGYYYKKEMGGSFSIKSVLPAVCPNDPSLDYHALDEVHNGTEAMNIFPLIKNMPPEQAQETRKNLLKYCELDTLALVKVWEELKRVSK